MKTESAPGWITYPEEAFKRAFFRFPLVLWRMGLGPLYGKIMMVLTTTGRKSGLPRRAAVGYEEMGGALYTVSMYGRRADWYKNLEADPLVTVQTAAGAQSMKAVRITEDAELVELFELYMEKHEAMFGPYLEQLDIAPNEEALLQNKHKLYWVRFEPTAEPTPPPLGSDLKWLWAPIGTVALLILLRLLKRRNNH